MGLDMYLDKKEYVGGYEPRARVTVDGVLRPKAKYVVEEGIYWRKANAIHKWFVEHVQNEVDDCREYDVSREQLTELLKVVEEVIEFPSKAGELLPTQGGFFFGGVDYDEYYYQELYRTRDELKALLSEKGEMWIDYTYQSSW